LLHLVGYLDRCTKMMHGHTNIEFCSLRQRVKFGTTGLRCVVLINLLSWTAGRTAFQDWCNQWYCQMITRQPTWISYRWHKCLQNVNKCP